VVGRSLKEVDLTAVKKSAGAATAPAKKAAPATRAATPKKAGSAKKAAVASKATKTSPAKAPGKKAPAKPSGAKPSATKASAAKAPPAAKPPTKKAQPAARPPAAKSVTTKAPATKAAPAAKKATKKATQAPAKAVKKAAPEPPKRPTVGPYAKDTKFLEAQRALLLEERAIYAGQAVDLRAEADSLALEREPGDVQFDEESGEGGTVTVDRERNLALSAQATAAVEEIDDAMKKIGRKTYGGCERCFQPIPKARLQALPFARLCVACKSGGLSRR
jgi:RNA polymerase-binding transcription factor DksA